MSEFLSLWNWLFWLTTIYLMSALVTSVVYIESSNLVDMCITYLMIAGIYAIQLILLSTPARHNDQYSNESVDYPEYNDCMTIV
jgi:hypothetical protein